MNFQPLCWYVVFIIEESCHDKQGFSITTYVPGTLWVVINGACEALFKHVRDDSSHRQRLLG